MLRTLLGFQFTVHLPALLGLIATYYLARYFWEKETIEEYEKRAVFISGCDTGFGRALALKCAKAGLTVFAGCLTKQGEESLQTESHDLPLLTCPLDVSKDESVAEARKFVDKNLKTGIKLWSVVANAGVMACYGPDEWNTIDDYKFAIEINTFGVVRVVQVFMDLIKESEGRIVAVSSVCGRISLPASAPYSVSKYGVEAYIDCIRQETAAYGVKCSLLEPGAFKTALTDKDALRSRVTSRWEKLSLDKKAIWTEQYKDWLLDNYSCATDILASSNINIVVNNYFHAITAKYPRRRYLCGLDAVLFFLPFSLLDARFTDPVFIRIAGANVRPIDLEKKEKND